jgi:hypothetical protein
MVIRKVFVTGNESRNVADTAVSHVEYLKAMFYERNVDNIYSSERC